MLSITWQISWQQPLTWKPDSAMDQLQNGLCTRPPPPPPPLLCAEQSICLQVQKQRNSAEEEISGHSWGCSGKLPRSEQDLMRSAARAVLPLLLVLGAAQQIAVIPVSPTALR